MMFNKNAFIVSCQAEGDDPFNSPEGVSMFAKAAEMGGADGIRSEGIAKTKKIIDSVSIPVIGLIKTYFEDGLVKITGSLSDVKELHEIGCRFIAIDGTFRLREGITGPDFISRIKSKYDCEIMADISTIEEAIACQNSGADCISTTLNGYTEATKFDNNGEPNFQLIKELTNKIDIPIFAEGRISNPIQAKQMIDCGAFGVVVGTLITRPRVVTNSFVKFIKS